MIFCEPNNEDCVTGECVAGFVKLYTKLSANKKKCCCQKCICFFGAISILFWSINSCHRIFHWSFMLFFEFHAISYHSIDLKRLERKKKNCSSKALSKYAQRDSNWIWQSAVWTWTCPQHVFYVDLFAFST